jgi:hypothetical protein
LPAKFLQKAQLASFQLKLAQIEIYITKTECAAPLKTRLVVAIVDVNIQNVRPGRLKHLLQGMLEGRYGVD